MMTFPFFTHLMIGFGLPLGGRHLRTAVSPRPTEVSIGIRRKSSRRTETRKLSVAMKRFSSRVFLLLIAASFAMFFPARAAAALAITLSAGVTDDNERTPIEPGTSFLSFSRQIVVSVESTTDEALTFTARGVLAPPVYFHLQPGDARAFQVVWRVPAALTKASMGLKGNTVAEKFDLTLSKN